MDMDNIRINRLKESMFKRGLTARELACKSNISEASISRYLSGKLVPKQGTIQALAEALDVDPVWLLGYDPVTPENDAANDQKAIEQVNLSNLTEANRARLLAYYQALVDSQGGKV